MAEDRSLNLFGSELRTKILIFLALLEESHAAELARLIGVSRSTVYRALENLESEGYVSSVVSGNERWARINPRNPSAEPLRNLLTNLAEGNRKMIADVSKLRRRPRRRGKEIQVKA